MRKKGAGNRFILARMPLLSNRSWTRVPRESDAPSLTAVTEPNISKSFRVWTLLVVLKRSNGWDALRNLSNQTNLLPSCQLEVSLIIFCHVSVRTATSPPGLPESAGSQPDSNEPASHHHILLFSPPPLSLSANFCFYPCLFIG